MKRRAIHFIAAFAAVFYAVYVYFQISGVNVSVAKPTGDVWFDLGQQIGQKIGQEILGEFFKPFLIYVVTAAFASLLFLDLKWHIAYLAPVGVLVYGWLSLPSIVDATSKLLLPMWPVIILLIIAALIPNKKESAPTGETTAPAEKQSSLATETTISPETVEDPFELLRNKGDSFVALTRANEDRLAKEQAPQASEPQAPQPPIEEDPFEILRNKGNHDSFETLLYANKDKIDQKI